MMVENTLSYERIIEETPIGIYRVPMDFEILESRYREGLEEPVETSMREANEKFEPFYVNNALADILGFDSADELRSDPNPLEYMISEYNPEDLDYLLETQRLETHETTYKSKQGEEVICMLSGFHEEGTWTGYVFDVTEQKQLEQKAIEQAAAILELSTPIVQIWEGITLATVVGTLDTNRAQQMTEKLLDEITENESDVALIDITGVPTIDTATAQHLIDTVNAVSLMGSEIIITGLSPKIAQTLVQLNIPMEDIRTKSSLSEGLELGLNLTNNLQNRPEDAE